MLNGNKMNGRTIKEWAINTMDSPEKLRVLGAHDTRRGQTKQISQHNICWTPLYPHKH